MTAHYEEIMELWKSGNLFDAIGYYFRWMPEGLVSEDESESFKKELGNFLEFIEAECEENPKVLFSLYQALKKARPIGIVAGVLGTGVFILSLPFTLPTGSVDDAAQMFIVKPFEFSFTRKFPDSWYVEIN